MGQQGSIMRAAKSDNHIPDNIRWSLCGETACGIQAYMRPCQRATSLDLKAEYPISALCATTNEKVLICDDDPDFCAELSELVGSFGFAITACSSVYELQSVAQDITSGCILLDIRMPGQDGLSAQDWLTKNIKHIPVIFISAVDNIDVVISAMRGGAIDFIKKPINEMTLRKSISKAVGISRKLYCADSSRESVSSLLNSLTPTEKFVADLIAKGYPTKLIASEMERSENTVKIHRHRILNKLKVSSAASIANIRNHCGSSGASSIVDIKKMTFD